MGSLIERLVGGGDDGGEDLPETSWDAKGSDRIRLVHDGLLRLGLATGWRARDVDELTMRDYRNAVGHATGADVNGTRFEKSDLEHICYELEIHVPWDATTRTLREAIGARLSLGYDTPSGHVRGFREDELQRVAMAVIKAAHEGRP